VWKPFERTNWIPGTFLSTAVVVFAWAYFIWAGSIGTIWPMFGTANQLLAGVALAVASSAIINAGKVRYVWVTMVPMFFVSITTLVAGWFNIFDNYLPLASKPETATQGYVNTTLTVVIMTCAVIILIEAFRRWYKVLVLHETFSAQEMIFATEKVTHLPGGGCC